MKIAIIPRMLHTLRTVLPVLNSFARMKHEFSTCNVTFNDHFVLQFSDLHVSRYLTTRCND